jgi:rod shape-determining protein MreD
MQSATHSDPRILRPVNPFFIAATIFIALCLSMLPTRNWPFLPDWLMLVLCFWNVREERRVGMGWSFVLGLMLDVADGAALGQHALAFVIMSFFATGGSRRLLWFPARWQALHVLPLFIGVSALQAAIRILAGAPLPGLPWALSALLVSPALAALLWLPLTPLLLVPQYRPEELNENNPI